MKAFWTFVTNDWWIAFPLFAMSLTGVGLVFWRLLLNYNGATNLNEFLPNFQQKLDREGPEGALRYCKARQDIIPRRLFAAGLEVHKQGLAAVRRNMANAIELDILPDLNFLLPSILAIAKIATMVGLLGTVISMIGTFNEIAKGSAGGTAGQAQGIGLALFATAFGLITAIPLVFAHVLFKAWVAKFETRLKSSALKLNLLLQSARSGKAAAPAGAAPGAAQPGAKPGDPSPTRR